MKDENEDKPEKLEREGKEEKEIDKMIIKKLVGYKHINFDKAIWWFNCHLHNADIQDFKDRETYDDAIKNDDETFLIFIIIYSFQRMGFDSKLPECKKKCDFYRNKEKIKTHPLSVLKALNEIKREYKADNIKQLLGCEEIEKLAVKWFKKSKEIHKKFGKGFNERGFSSKYLISFLKYFSDGKINNLRELIRGGEFKNAFELLTESKTEIKGIGPKVAKFAIRDLAFSLTLWAKDKEITDKDVEVLSYALPIDIWVRRCAMSIPTIGEEVKGNLKRADLVDNNLVDKVDKIISTVIAERCCNMRLNPLLFDYGAYLFGLNEVKRKTSKISIDKIYGKLKDVLFYKGEKEDHISIVNYSLESNQARNLTIN